MRDSHSPIPDKGSVRSRFAAPAEAPELTEAVVNEIPRDDIPQLHETGLSVKIPFPREDAVQRSRLLVLDKVYVHIPGQDSELVQFDEAVLLETDEQVCQRQLKAGDTWSTLAEGMWIESPSLLVVCNLAGTNHRQTRPTEQQIKDVAAQVLEVSIGGLPFALIPPGRSLRLVPFDLRSLAIRCRSGIAKYSVALFPK